MSPSPRTFESELETLCDSKPAITRVSPSASSTVVSTFLVLKPGTPDVDIYELSISEISGVNFNTTLFDCSKIVGVKLSITPVFLKLYEVVDDNPTDDGYGIS